MARQLDIIEVECWKQIPSRPGFFASSLGRIRGPQKILSQQIGRGWGRYRTVTLHSRIHGFGGSVLVHRAVMEAFFGPPPDPKMQVHHRNNDPNDNRLMNLEYVTVSQNGLAKHEHGTMPLGEENGASKLTAKDVLEIRKMRQSGALKRDIAEHFGISETQAANIYTRRQWRHI